MCRHAYSIQFYNIQGSDTWWDRRQLCGSPESSRSPHPWYAGILTALPSLSYIGQNNQGKTRTTEFAATPVGTICGNPHDPKRTPGGSSSGSAAVVADFQAPLALGTQTGGSIIRPGSFNGILAFKPTWNAISREGLKIHSVTCDTLGFFARTVDDM